MRQWNRLLDEATHERRELPVMSFCGCCSAEALIAGGRLDDAERELARTLQIVEQSGTRGRCVDPRARLADLLVRQGRFEEAEQLLPGADGDGWRPGTRRAPPCTWRAGRCGSCPRAAATPDGTEVIEFSPTAELERTLEVVFRNAAAAQT